MLPDMLIVITRQFGKSFDLNKNILKTNSYNLLKVMTNIVPTIPTMVWEQW